MSSDLADRLAVAEERIQQLLAELGADEPMPRCLGLTAQRAAILGVILKREVASIRSLEMVLAARSGERHHAPTPNSVAVQVTGIRKNLAAFGIAIKTRWGEGYWMMEADKVKLRALFA